jgi:GT2 family glycosyltransferase
MNLDAYRHHEFVARVLDCLLADTPRPVHLLQVGGQAEPLRSFLDTEQVRIRHVGPDLGALEENAFDAVVALDALPCVPADRRRAWLSECLRAARRGAVFTTPDGTAEVAAYEAVAAAARAHRCGEDPSPPGHPGNTYPAEDEIRADLEQLSCAPVVLAQQPLNVWLASVVLGETLAERTDVAGELATFLRRALETPPFVATARCYRKAYVCARSAEDAQALTTLAGPGVVPAAEARDAAADLQDLASVAARALNALADDRRRRVRDLQEQLADCLADRAALSGLLAAARRSAAWRWLGPLRAAARALRPRDHHAADLQPLRGLTRLDDAGPAWQVAGPDAALLMPAHLAPGRARLRLRLCSDTAGTAVLHLHAAGGTRRLEALTLSAGEALEFARCYKWDEEVRGLRLHPLDVPGRIFIEQFDVEPLPLPRLLCLAGAAAVRKLSPGSIARHLLRGRLRSLRAEVRRHLPPVHHIPTPPPPPRPTTAAEAYARWRQARPRAAVAAVPSSPLLSVLLPLTGNPLPHLHEAVASVRGQLYPHWELCIADATGDPDVRSLLQSWAAAEPRIKLVHRQGDGSWGRIPILTYQQGCPDWNPDPQILADVAAAVIGVPSAVVARSPDRATPPTEGLPFLGAGETFGHPGGVVTRPRHNSDGPRHNSGACQDWNPNPHIPADLAAACNAALGQATGAYVARLDAGDRLAEDALLRVAHAVGDDPAADMLYSDEDVLDPDGRHVEPYFKPDWSPELFLATQYTGRLAVYRTARVREAGGFDAAFAPALDHDLALRLMARGARVGHLPHVLYHRHRPAADPAEQAATQRALQRHLADTGVRGRVEPQGPGLFRVRFALRGRPKVSIVIPTAGRGVVKGGARTTYLAACLASIRGRTTYDNYEILAVLGEDFPAELARELRRWDVVPVVYRGPLNIAAKMNRGAAAATGEHVLLLNDDTEVISPDWLQALLEFSQQPAVGAAGARLYYPDGHLQHVGAVVQSRSITHSFRGFPGDHPGYFHSAVAHRNCSAVTGACLMTRADVFAALGGFDEAFAIDFNDVDYCLRLLQGGWRVVYTPYAELFHHESVTRAGSSLADWNLMQERWASRLRRDPYYSPHFAADNPDYEINPAAPPPEATEPPAASRAA